MDNFYRIKIIDNRISDNLYWWWALLPWRY
jgi:hypothetical protein